MDGDHQSSSSKVLLNTHKHLTKTKSSSKSLNILQISKSDLKLSSPIRLLPALTILIPSLVPVKQSSSTIIRDDQISAQQQQQSLSSTQKSNDDKQQNSKFKLIMLPTEQSILLNESGDITSMVTDTSATVAATNTEVFGSSDETKKLLVQYLSQHPMLKSFMVGALSGTCSTLLFQPFDLLKTRVQSAHISLVGQQASTSVSSSSSSVTRTTRFLPIMMDVIKNEQIIGLWRGTAPSLFRCVPGVGIHFCCLDTLQSHFCPNRKPTPLEAMLFGMLSRSIASVMLIPVTVVKTRYESGIYSYKNITDALRHTYQNEGLRGLRSGLLPTLMRDVPFSGLYFMFYSQFKSFVLPKFNNNDNTQDAQQQYSKLNMLSSSSLTFLCGLSAGLMASIVTQPMDVVKTRMQLNSRQFPTFIETTLFIAKQEKISGLFAGLVPRMMRRTLMASMAWTVYEQMMKSLCLK